MLRWTVPLLMACAAAVCTGSELPHTVWLEAETFAPLHGSNFSYQRVDQTTRGSWSVAGPGVAAEWTQGGESEWMSIATRADEPGEVTCSRDAEMPAAGRYTLWVRYADYRNKKESFGVRLKQGARTFSHIFGEHPVIDELDPMKLLWDWSFGWDHVAVDLEKGPIRIELYTTGPTEARRQVDCLCLTTDGSYHPAGREKPDCAAWLPLREKADVRPLVPTWAAHVPQTWKIADGPPAFLWNTGESWLNELKRPERDRIQWPFTVDPPIEKEFLGSFRGKDLAVYGAALSGPATHISNYPSTFAPGSPLPEWLIRHPERKFGIVLNYGEPSWPKDADKQAVYRQFKQFGDRSIGFVAGESISYDQIDGDALDRAVASAKSRADVLAALRDAHERATAKKFSTYLGVDLSPREAFAMDIPCLSGNMEAYAHALADWGVKRIGHENTANSPTLARRLAFLRGAARQFEARICDYQSCNLGDASNIFSRQASFWPGSSRYILDNSYDVWAGAGLNWVLKDYLLFWLAGADAFYHEEGNDIYWKPGGIAAGDEFPVALSPRGRVTEAVMKLMQSHRIGTQITPIAFLLDEAHGWSQERFSPASFALDREKNPAVLTPGLHEAAIRGWFDIAYYPAPETQNEPATSVRQTYVNGIFGDIFDVIVTAPNHTQIARTYPVLIADGEVPLSQEWGRALRDYIESGGTLVVCANQFSGPGAAELKLPDVGALIEASSFQWKLAGNQVLSNVFRFHPSAADGAQVLAETADGKPIATLSRRGKGQLVYVGIPLGLGIDQRPVPILSLLMRHLAQDLMPARVQGDVEWAVNRLDDGGLLLAILNNRGVPKPQHGILPTDHREAQHVTITTGFVPRRSEEWIAGAAPQWLGASAHLAIPPGAVRLVTVH